MALALAMVIGRFLIIAVLARARSPRSGPGVITAGTLRTYSPTFVFLIVGATLLVVGRSTCLRCARSGGRRADALRTA